MAGRLSPLAPTMIWLLLACSPAEPPPPQEVAPPPDPVVQRVDETHRRLAASEGGQLLRTALDAHGGLQRWLEVDTLAFTFRYEAPGDPPRLLHTRSQVDVRTSRVRQEQVGTDLSFGFDGSAYFVSEESPDFPTSTEFWALTPYYFVGMPFVLADPGTRHEKLDGLSLDGAPVDAVKVSYDPGTGEAPDDYYVLYLDPETHHMLALRYIVSWPGRFEPGTHSPEKLLRYRAPVTVGGLRFSTHYDGVKFDPETLTPGALASTVDVTDIQVGPALPDSAFSQP